VWLPWQDAMWIAAGLFVFLVLARNVRVPAVRVLRSTAKEAIHVLFLYATWQWVHHLAVTKTDGARENGLWVWRVERAWHLPSEVSLERALIDHRRTMQFLNIFYGGAHVPAMAITLLWLFFRHRDRYPAIRTTLALLTLGCLLIQTIPVAPPRFYPELGFVDAGLLYDLSVYGRGGSGLSNQLAAMPSLHVGWAVLVAVAVITVSRSKHRWWVLLHPAMTMLAVTATANHWWLDGIAAAGVLVVAMALRALGHRVVELVRLRLRRPEELPLPAEPVLEPA
jgi:hypothetical protein